MKLNEFDDFQCGSVWRKFPLKQYKYSSDRKEQALCK